MRNPNATKMLFAISNMTHLLTSTSTSLTSTPQIPEARKNQTSVFDSLLFKMVVKLKGWRSKLQSPKVSQWAFWIPSPRQPSAKFQPRENQQDKILRLLRVASTALEGFPRTAASIPMSVSRDGLTELGRKNNANLRKSFQEAETGVKTDLSFLEMFILKGYADFCKMSSGLTA